MNHFGGNWTEDKIEILVEYAKAYLKIMNPNAEKFDWKLLYFDGFAGSGEIKKGNDEDEKIIIGAAKRILEIDNPRAFDMYYFVEKEEANVNQLKVNTVEKFPHKDIKVVAEDCNNKIHSMSGWLKNEGKKYKVLAYKIPAVCN
ncbi:MAG: three-Cys-motif partner protein TcmP [Crocinitomix sp.]|nr:three-Cys-motif partner protein TcmP [Crocinitomix sp.]